MSHIFGTFWRLPGFTKLKLTTSMVLHAYLVTYSFIRKDLFTIEHPERKIGSTKANLPHDRPICVCVCVCVCAARHDRNPAASPSWYNGTSPGETLPLEELDSMLHARYAGRFVGT